MFEDLEQVYAAALEAMHRGESAAMATVIEAHGSTPRGASAPHRPRNRGGDAARDCLQHPGRDHRRAAGAHVMWVCKNWGLIYLADQDKGFIILGDHYSNLTGLATRFLMRRLALHRIWGQTGSSKDLLGLG
jgi:hypothetical protein